MSKNKNIDYSKKFRFDDEQSYYEFQLKKRSRWWLWLLLLLLLLLLLCVRCNRAIDVETYDACSGTPVACDSVTIEYTSHYLYKDGSLFVNEFHSITEASDSTGVTRFTDLPCSVFSYIFYAFSKVEYSVNTPFYDLMDAPVKSLFHYTWKQRLNLKARTADIALTVIDRETEDPLSDALVQYSYPSCGVTISDSVRTDVAGKIVLTDVPLVCDINVARASCYAYHDTTDVTIPVYDALENEELSMIPLTPIKESFTFFVKNKFTHDPIPAANVELILKDRKNEVRHGPISTNVDGTGRGAFNDAFVGATLILHASKTNFKDSVYTPICTVAEFVAKPDSLRVIYLEPLPNTRTFIDVDSITRKPIPGVMNHIVVNSIDGHEYRYDEPSNRKGAFTVKALDGDRITIDSELEPGYEPKHTEIAKFEKEETILMKPRLTDLVFRTVVADTHALLPDCNLSIRDSEGNTYLPTNSGSGTFTVKNLRVAANLYIVASKPRYGENDFTISGAKVAALMKAPQNKRDIPLVEGLEPCDASASGKTDVKAGSVSDPTSYNMGCKEGTFILTWNNGGSCPDCIDVYNHEPGEPYNVRGKIFSTGMTPSTGTSAIRFTNGSVITIVVITGPKDGSSWDYTISCPK